MGGIERREHLRIDDRLYFDFHIIILEEGDHSYSFSKTILKEEQDQFVDAARYLQQIDIELGDLTETIAIKDATIAHYLNLLNAKVNFLSKQIMLKGEVNSHEVNISTGGMSFYTDHDLKKNTAVKIILYTKPKMIPVFVNAIVVYNAPGEDNNYRIAIEFKDLSPESQQVLSEHIMLAQMRQRAEN